MGTRRYFYTIKGNRWTFACNNCNRRGKNKLISLYPIASTAIERPIKVKGAASPDDPTLKNHWEKRHQKHCKTYWEKNSKYSLVAQAQNWKCRVCGESIFNGEEIETHHMVPVAEGDLEDADNLQHLHTACHKQVHSLKSKLKRAGSKA